MVLATIGLILVTAMFSWLLLMTKHVYMFEPHAEGTSTPQIPTLHSDSHHAALLPGLVARCALVESRGGRREVLQQDAPGVAVVYARRKDAIPSAAGSAFRVDFITSSA